MMRELIEYSNALACLLLLIAAFPVAKVMRSDGIWGYRLLLWALLVGLACQAMAPWIDFVAYVPLPVAIVNWSALIGAIVWRREVMVFARCRFGQQPEKTPHRRAADVDAAVVRRLYRN